MQNVLSVLKRTWYHPERPARIRVRPASNLGLVMARAKVNLGLGLVANGLGDLGSLHPTRQVGESALSVVNRELSKAPRQSFMPAQRGPIAYPGELLGAVVALFALTITAWFMLGALDLVPVGPGYEIRDHLTQPIVHLVRRDA